MYYLQMRQHLYGLQLTKRAKELIEDFCTAKTGGTIWDLEKYAFDHKTTYELINKKYEVLLLEAQNKIVDSYFQYIEKKREPKDRFYMPRRKQLIKIGLVDALQGMIDDKYEGLLFPDDKIRRYFNLPHGEPEIITAQCDTKGKGTDYFVMPILQKYGED